MKKKLIALIIASSLAAPISANAVEVAGEKLNVYGKIHVSIDNSDRDIVGVTNDGLSVSSNSSRLGFKGKVPLENGMSVVYQLEQEAKFDETGSSFASRNSFVGLGGGFGKIIVGYHDTPFKTAASKWGVFGDSVGERRSILGAGYNSGNQLNERAKNAIMYEGGSKALKFQAMYAVDPESAADGAVDNNDKKVTSIGLFGNTGNLWYTAAYESWEQHSKIIDGDALRIGASYKFGGTKVGVIYESIDSDTVAEWKRDAYGINAVFKVGAKTDFRAQYLTVDDADGTSNTGATKLGLGVYHKLDKMTKVYVAYGATDNDAGAAFQAVDGGHGDEVKTVAGGNPSSISVGMEFKF